MTGKKKVILACTLIIALGIIWGNLPVNASVAGTMENSCTNPTDKRSTISVSGTAGQTLTFELRSKIKEGDVQFFIIDSEGNIIGSFGQDEADKKIVFEEDDIYEIASVSRDLVGKFKLSIYKK